MRIAILGWGSLIWDKDKGQLLVASGWEPGGPTLPIELSGVDHNRRLTLVIDSARGTAVPVRFAESARSVLEDAILDLAAREKHVERNQVSHECERAKEYIGWIDRTDDHNSRPGHHPQEIIATIRTWAENHRFDAVAWSNFPPDFERKTGLSFSPEHCVDHLRTLEGDEAQKAREYIQNAPAEVDTPVRRRIYASDWWRAPEQETPGGSGDGLPGAPLPARPSPPQEGAPDVPGGLKDGPASGTSFGQEIRFAIVMYGGISLAIYMHGVAQELLRLVRATSGADLGGDEVAKIYRELSGKVRDQDRPDQQQPVPTRFVIDVLSGTSAGGINAVFLAKALAVRSKDLEKLRQTWLEMADMDQILNRRGSPARSLLNGNWMYQKLYQAFSDMSTGPLDDRPIDQLDLFVTTTDLNGVSIPIRLADMDIPEKVHKGCFNFRYDDLQLAKGPGANPLDQELDALRRNDFEQPLDAMLAFACRCTSSFPIAFAPMKLADIEPVIGEAAYAQGKEKYYEFFRWIPPTPLIPVQSPLAADQRELADGGYLDNKPFDYVIDALTFRATTRRHTRKLFFVDPFPEIAGDAVDQPHFDFLENAIAGSMTLPHYQTIREEIDRVKALNRTQERLQKLQQRTMPGRPPGEFKATTVNVLTRQYGSVYGTYHVVRLFDCTDDVARVFCGLPASVQSEDPFLAVRYLVRAWREATYAPNGEDGKQLENQFFTDFDFSFRMRRAVHLLEWAQRDAKPDLCTLLIRHLTRLRRRREQLSLAGKTNPIWPAILESGLNKELTWDRMKLILEPTTDDERMDRARKLYGRNRPAIEKVVGEFRQRWTQVFDLNRGELRAFLERDPRLEDEYQAFDYRDMVSLAFLEGSDVSEHAETEIYRISPADGIQRPLDKKLAGYAVQAFGAFLKLEWRQNDILWGRLDACERIVSAVLNHEADKALRHDFVTRLQDAIVQQEANLRSTQDLAPALQAVADHRLGAYMKDQYVLPDGPAPKDSARQIASGADIFGRMIEDDVGQKNRLTVLLRSGGGLAAQLVGLLTPGSLGRVFWNYWLALFGVTAGLLFVLGWIAGQPQAKTLGAYGVGAAILVGVLSGVIGHLLVRVRTPTLAIRLISSLLAIAFVVLMLIGLLHLPRDAHDLWQRIWHPGGEP